MKYIIWLPVFFFLSCNTGIDTEDTMKNYIPITPKLDSNRLTPEVLWSFGRLGSHEVSPDGSTVLYTVTWYNIGENKSYRDVFSIPVSGGETTNLTNTAQNESNALWRPDNKKIGYLSAASGSTQLWEMNPDGTGKSQITHLDGGLSAFGYSPDLSRIYYIKNVKLDKDIHDIYPDLPKANARLETDLMYRHWDEWHNYSYNHIFIANYNDGKINEGIDIMQGETYDSPMKPFGGMEQIAWSPDGRLLAFTMKKKKGKEYSLSTNSDIYIYNTETGQTINFTEGMMGYDKNPVFSPDGKYIAWESMERDGYESDKNRLFIAELETGRKTDLSDGFDQNAGNLAWDNTGRYIYFISSKNATEQIYKADIKEKVISKLTEGIHNYQMVKPASNGLIAQKVSMSEPAELYIVNPESGVATQLSKINNGILGQLKMGRVEERRIETTDGKKMLTWVVYPPDFNPDNKYPALLYCQGGPQSTVSQFWSYRWNLQLMAANGYIVVAPNRRGLPGFGQEWNEQISRDYGGQNIEDLLTAIDDVAREPYVDENKLGAVGASYGGFSVYYLAGNHNKRFRAFIAHDGMFNLEHMYSTTEEMWFVNWDIGGPYWDEKNAAAQRSYSFSPHKYVQNWDTPILVIHGEKDFRIPPDQGIAAFNSAVLQDIPAQFLYFPDENHWVLQPQNGILWQRVFFDWLDKWLKD